MNKSLCKLCLQPKELRDSHIISEFDYKPLYDHKHRFYRLSSKSSKHGILQKGLREKLLCGYCENLRSKCEIYASKLIHGGIELDYKNFVGGVEITGIDYNKFKLHQLFLLWITSISQLPEFSEIKLHENVEEKLRLKLLSNDPGQPHEYPCFVCALISKNRNTTRQIIIPPSLIEVEGIQWARFIIGGLIWTYRISVSSDTGIPDDFFINRNGVLNVYFVHPSDVNFLTETLVHILEPSLVRYSTRSKSELRKFIKRGLLG